ncbi:MAG: MFS transporter [Hyphomicrobiaceae bacterium]
MSSCARHAPKSFASGDLPSARASGDLPSARRGVVVVVGATLAMALGFGSLALTSIFMRPLEAQFGWTRAEISLAYAIASAGMALGGLGWGWASDRMKIRTLLAIGGSGMVLSVLAMSATQSLWHLYLANAILGGFGFAVLYAPLLTATGEWFEVRRGLAVGIVTAGGALGQGVVPFSANFLIDGIGWRAAYLTIAVVMFALLAVSLPLVRRPERVHPPERRASTLTAHDPHGAARQRIALLSLAAFLCCACMGIPLVHLASFVTIVCGSPSVGATSLLVAMLFGTAGRVCFGLLADRIGYLASYAGASLLQTMAVAAYPLLDDSASILTLSAVFGFGFAGNMTCLVLCIRQAVPEQRFGSALGLVMLVAWLGMGVGGYAGGALFDSTGSYVAAFFLAGAIGVLNLIVIGIVMAARRATFRRVQIPVTSAASA